jgi:alpha-ribazole phosphatase/probable phosphoglycerate mutase
MTITTLDFLRHGEPEGGRKYRGQVDDPLSAKGWDEMRRATQGERPWQAIVASPLARCRVFAETLAADLGLPLALEDRLKEVGFGAWEGRTGADIRAGNPDLLFDFKRDPVTYRPAGAEPLDAFAARVALAFDDLAAAHAGGHILVVAHAGVIRMVLCHVLGLPPSHAYRLQVGSAAKARVRVEQRGERRLSQLLWLDAGQGGGE